MDAIIIDNNASIIRRVYYIINLRGEIYGEISVLLFTSIIVWSHIHSNDFVLFVHRYFLYGPFFSFFCWSSRPGRYYTSINSENSLDYKNNSIIFVSFVGPLGQVDTNININSSEMYRLLIVFCILCTFSILSLLIFISSYCLIVPCVFSLPLPSRPQTTSSAPY